MPGEHVSAFHSIPGEAHEAQTLNLFMIYLVGKRRGFQRVWSLKRMKSYVEGPEGVLILYLRCKDFLQGKELFFLSLALINPLK